MAEQQIQYLIELQTKLNDLNNGINNIMQDIQDLNQRRQDANGLANPTIQQVLALAEQFNTNNNNYLLHRQALQDTLDDLGTNQDLSMLHRGQELVNEGQNSLMDSLPAGFVDLLPDGITGNITRIAGEISVLLQQLIQINNNNLDELQREPDAVAAGDANLDNPDQQGEEQDAVAAGGNNLGNQQQGVHNTEGDAKEDTVIGFAVNDLTDNYDIYNDIFSSNVDKALNFANPEIDKLIGSFAPHPIISVGDSLSIIVIPTELASLSIEQISDTIGVIYNWFLGNLSD